MEATQMWAEELTAQAEGKHHIGDFLPPDELKKFMEQYNAVKQGKEPDLSDYKEYKLKEDNIGTQPVFLCASMYLHILKYICIFLSVSYV